MSRSRFSLANLAIALLVCGGLAVAYSAFVLVRAHLYQRAAMAEVQWTSPAPPLPPAFASARPIADGMPLARFEIPRLNMDIVVIEGDSDEDLRLGAGHIPGTALPGAVGNVGIAGHRDTVFRPLRNIQSGDVIRLMSAGNVYHYQVESTEVVTPDRSDVLNFKGDRQLTLVTCFPFYYIGSAPKRFIVHAREIDADRPSNAGQ
jgi:sortase A